MSKEVPMDIGSAVEAQVMPPTTDEASTNFYWSVGKVEVFNMQTTLRGAVDADQVKVHLAGVLASLKELVLMGGHAKGGKGEPVPAPNAASPILPMVSTVTSGGALITPTVAQAVPAPANGQTHENACVLIEVGTSYQGGKTQLKFHVNGMDHPLTYTREVGDMVKLLAPLGFMASHIVVGQKYQVNAVVTWAQADKYRNVIAVRAVTP